MINQLEIVRYQLEKPILLNLVNLSTIFSPRLPEEAYFHF